jgi:hypothetical protein
MGMNVQDSTHILHADILLVTSYTNVVHKVEQHLYVKAAVLPCRIAQVFHAELQKASGNSALLYQTTATRGTGTLKWKNVNS